MDTQDDIWGVLLSDGPQDWQIFQQDQQGFGSMHLRGQWRSDMAGAVETRLVWEDTGMPVTPALDWHPADTQIDGYWAATLRQIPAGGLYRLELRLNCQQMSPFAALETRRGDMRHFLGVGDLWVIAGQSNAAGSARGAAADSPTLGVHCLRPNGAWSLATHPLNEATATRHPAQRDANNPGHSPWLRFGMVLQERLGYPIGLLPTALGGSPLSAWNPTEHADPLDAVLFANMCQVIHEAGDAIRGVVWYQGESDTNPRDATTYLDRFSRMLTTWRDALALPDLPILTAQLNRFPWPDSAEVERGWSQIREAQRQAARQVPQVTVIPTLDLPLSDLIHLSPAGNSALAQRFADAALGVVYGYPVAYQAPDLQTAQWFPSDTSAGGHIVLTFAHVTSRLEALNGLMHPFHVSDSHGEVPISAIHYPGDATVRLELGRGLIGPGVIHGGYGMHPAAMPVDSERVMPALAFLDIPIETR